MLSAYDLFPWELDGVFYTPTEMDINVPNASTLLLDVDVQRVAIVMAVGGAGAAVTISTKGTIIQGNGSLLSNTSTPLFFTYDLYGPAIQGQWRAISTTPSNFNVNVLVLRANMSIVELMRKLRARGTGVNGNGKDKIGEYDIGSYPDYGYTPPFEQSPPSWINDFGSANQQILNRIQRGGGGTGPRPHVLPAYRPADNDKRLRLSIERGNPGDF